MPIRADLHIHTVLSPCGDLDMSPSNIIRMAGEKGLGIIGITDHNSTRQSPIIRELGRQHGIFVLTGAEVTTAEEVHCLVFFNGDKQLSEFQAFLDKHLPPIPNKPEKFGYQVIADENDRIIGEEKKLLITALDLGIEAIQKEVSRLDGIFIPAHIDKPRFSILSQLGFIPGGLNYDALEISPHTDYTTFTGFHPELLHMPFIQSSDAHYPADIGKVYTLLNPEQLDFQAIRQSIRKRAG